MNKAYFDYDFNFTTLHNYIRDNRLDKIKETVEQGIHLTCEEAKIAAANGKIEIMEYILKQDIYISSNIIDAAVANNQIDMIEYLLAYGLNPSQYSIRRAIESGSTDAVQYLYEHCPSILRDGEDLINAIRHRNATRYGNVDLVKYLIDNSKKLSQDTLYEAVKQYDYNTLKLLVERNVKISNRLINYAISCKNKLIIRYLALHSKSITYGNISKASEYCDTETLKFLVETSGKKDLSKISVDRAAEVNRVESLIYLAEHGARLTTTTLNKLAKRGDIETIGYLLKHGIKINSKTVSIALNNGKLMCAKFLVENGGTLSASSLDDIIENGDEEMAKYLLEHGAKPSDASVLKAIKSNQFNIMKYLIDAGAKVTEESVTYAASNNMMEFIKYLIENKVCKIPNDAIYQATVHRFFDMADYLIAHGGKISRKLLSILGNKYYHVKKSISEDMIVG